MSGDTYLKTEVLYAGGAVQQYIATNPLSFAGADGSSPLPPALDECPPLIPPIDPTPQPQPVVEPPPPPCIDIPGYDKCVQIAPSYRSFCGETWISWDDGVVWERAYNHEPQDTYYHGEAREWVWNVYKKAGYNYLSFKSGIVVLMPGAFRPKYGNDYGELNAYFKSNYLGGGSGLGSVQVPLNPDGTKGANWGEPMGWSNLNYLNPGEVDRRALVAGNDWKAASASGPMYPSYDPTDFFMLYLRDFCGGCTFAHYVETTYQWNGQWCQSSGYMADTLPVEVENWTTDPAYPLGGSSITTSFSHKLHVDFIYSPSVLENVTSDCEPWGVWWFCDRCEDPRYYGRDCPDCEEVGKTEDECPEGCDPPCPPKRIVTGNMAWSSENRDYWSQPALRYTTNNPGSSPYFSCGQVNGKSIGDLWQEKYSARQNGVWSAEEEFRKTYQIMPCQPVARHYTNTRSLPDPASLDGVEEYTVDNVGVAHRWVWSHADQQWFEHGEKPAPDGGVI